MARTKKSTRRPADRKGRFRLPWSPPAQALRVSAWVGGVAALAAAWTFGVPELHARVAATASVDETVLEFEDRPAWVRGDLLALLDMTARRQLGGDPLERDDLVRARTALLATEWFDDVAQVRRTRSGGVLVRADFVRPFAVVRDHEGDHQVDPAGKLLPRTYPHGEAVNQVVIEGARFDRPAGPGLPWDGADVTAALRLLRLIDDRSWHGQVTAIDVSTYMSRQQLVIVTDLGARIHWGSAPGDEQPLEVLSSRKLAYLDKAFEEFRRIDTGHAGDWHFYDQAYRAE